MKKTRYYFFQFRVNNDDRHMIEELAKHLDRSKSDALRVIIKDAYSEMCNTVLGKEQTIYGTIPENE